MLSKRNARKQARLPRIGTATNPMVTTTNVIPRIPDSTPTISAKVFRYQAGSTFNGHYSVVRRDLTSLLVCQSNLAGAGSTQVVFPCQVVKLHWVRAFSQSSATINNIGITWATDRTMHKRPISSTLTGTSAATVAITRPPRGSFASLPSVNGLEPTEVLFTIDAPQNSADGEIIIDICVTIELAWTNNQDALDTLGSGTASAAVSLNCFCLGPLNSLAATFNGSLIPAGVGGSSYPWGVMTSIP